MLCLDHSCHCFRVLLPFQGPAGLGARVGKITARHHQHEAGLHYLRIAVSTLRRRPRSRITRTVAKQPGALYDQHKAGLHPSRIGLETYQSEPWLLPINLLSSVVLEVDCRKVKGQEGSKHSSSTVRSGIIRVLAYIYIYHPESRFLITRTTMVVVVELAPGRERKRKFFNNAKRACFNVE